MKKGMFTSAAIVNSTRLDTISVLVKNTFRNIMGFFSVDAVREDDRSRINNLNAIRLFAAVMVIYGHMFSLLGFPAYSIVGNAVSTISIKTFFVISGFLLCDSWKRDSNLFRYTVRRFFRIVPGLVFLVLITIFIIGPFFTTLSLSQYFSHPSIFNYSKNIFLYINYHLPGVFETNIYPLAVNGSLWSLPVEVFMYILLPIIFSVGSKFKSPRFFLSLFAVFAVTLNLYVHIYHPDLFFIVYGTNIRDVISLMSYFFVGCVFSFPEAKKMLNVQVAFAAFIVMASLSVPVHLNELLLSILLPYCVLSIGLASQPVFWRIGFKNDYSYGIYLYGFLVQQMLISIMGTRFSVNEYFVICTFVTFLFAFLSWHLVEKKSLDISKKLITDLKKVSFLPFKFSTADKEDH